MLAPVQADELLSTQDVADLLGVTPSTISRRVATGELTPAMKAPGIRGAMFFRRADVETLGAESEAKAS